MKAMLFAAGLGTRLKPFTDFHPKALVEVNQKPVLQRNIEFLKSHGITEIVINVHHFASQIISFLDENNNFGCTIEISDETEELLETGGGLLKAKEYLFDDDFLVMNSDILTDLNLKGLIENHKKNNAIATLAVSDRESSRKLLFNDENRLIGWKNLISGEQILTDKNYYKEFAFSGIHIISPKLFDLIEETGKFSIMKSYMNLMTNNNIYGFVHNAKLIDVGKPEAIAQAELIFI
ncbi:MAG: nucleotidyltransferase family protein [Flavobacteriales bacterium]|nr:nucleotidyltransferase family protein [Flavobacteriales bacterium]